MNRSKSYGALPLEMHEFILVGASCDLRRQYIQKKDSNIMSQNRCAEEMLTFVVPKFGLPAIRFTNVTQNNH